jgi:hypothetical protein
MPWLWHHGGMNGRASRSRGSHDDGRRGAHSWPLVGHGPASCAPRAAESRRCDGARHPSLPTSGRRPPRGRTNAAGSRTPRTTSSQEEAAMTTTGKPPVNLQASASGRASLNNRSRSQGACGATMMGRFFPHRPATPSGPDRAMAHRERTSWRRSMITWVQGGSPGRQRVARVGAGGQQSPRAAKGAMVFLAARIARRTNKDAC